MDRLKSIIVVAPFFALAVAVAFIHGYWGAFGVLAFPYLSFQELVAYSAAPVFGFLLFAGAGMMLGAINATASSRSPRSKWLDRLQDIFLVALAAVLVYQKAPYRWVFAPLVVFGALLPSFFHWEPV
ncbi:hypothetical protein [Ideonella sp.]|uniref:hypothetical protein n=1 Tax=Ideonella sp. TaxID=1929293 RepID=UPI003BB647CC